MSDVQKAIKDLGGQLPKNIRSRVRRHIRKSSSARSTILVLVLVFAVLLLFMVSTF